MDNHTNEHDLPMCGICHNDPPINGVKLECGHIFCYLCIKSASEITCTCAICRAEIGFEFNFQEHNLLGTIKVPSSRDGYYWFYEGYQGWWLFDPDTNNEIEETYRRGNRKLEKFIAGGPYTIDLIDMLQRRSDEPHSRARKICRATLNLDNILGMAGLKGKDFKDVLEMMRINESHNQQVPPVPQPRTSLR